MFFEKYTIAPKSQSLIQQTVGGHTCQIRPFQNYAGRLPWSYVSWCLIRYLFALFRSLRLTWRTGEVW